MKKTPRRKEMLLKGIAMLLSVILATAVCWHEIGTLLTSGKVDSESAMVQSIMDKTATPGVAILSATGGKTEFKTYGYADKAQGKEVTADSLFEIGSTTKAFTALAVIMLQDQGDLAYTDDVSQYLPEFAPTYKGDKVKITINQLLAHTSGIPSWSIRLIPEGSGQEQLAATIHKMSSLALDTNPGSAYQYATVNYDILAAVIERVTGRSYQEYVTEHILKPLGMNDSYFSTGQEWKPEPLAQGYRVFFGKSMAYDAPRYYGNIAAGYLVTNLKDLQHWVNAQMGSGEVPDNLRKAIQQSHEPDLLTTGHEAENQFYAFGWSQDRETRVIRHSGSNPNYSSQAIIDPERKEGVFVLANLNSTAPTLIAQNIYDNMQGQPMKTFKYDDTYILMDGIGSLLVVLTVIGITFKLIRLAGGRSDFATEKGIRRQKIKARVTLFIRALLLLLVLGWPFLVNYNYTMISVWMSYSVLLWMGLASLSCVLSMILAGRHWR
ncbi:serine hydrolase domain-containing protein [Paenibacillus silagei]|uniref:CubicO group peptidase (Beta-lactamase class C family) n=1 Tax=Paenibacillus silagei TaxID=1670801 RepID=A0ABS4NKJ4_9BACL|nr:serine hydrolase domain-containing protein [Paenibacillus silagei]MBP2110580.1 CubicO group peptidase (beta-lactamase class C family) [Paenibacillus silagei]